MEQIALLLEKKKNHIIESNKVVRDQLTFQQQAIYIIGKLNISKNRKSAYFSACKRYPELVGSALSFAIDHPIIEARDKMFFWKLNDLVRSKKTI